MCSASDLLFFLHVAIASPVVDFSKSYKFIIDIYIYIFLKECICQDLKLCCSRKKKNKKGILFFHTPKRSAGTSLYLSDVYLTRTIKLSVGHRRNIGIRLQDTTWYLAIYDVSAGLMINHTGLGSISLKRQAKDFISFNNVHRHFGLV